MLLGSLRKRHSGGWRAGFMPGERETALAIVRTAKGHRPLLRHCAVHPAIEIQAEHVLAPLNHSRELARTAVSGILSSADYQLVTVEAPEVPAHELRAAVRWKLRDIVNFPVSEAVVDVFENIWPDADGRTEFHYVLVDFLCELISGEVKVASDASDARWISFEELDSWELIGKTAQAIRTGFAMKDLEAKITTPEDR